MPDIQFPEPGKYKCRNCGFVYDPEKGDPDYDIPIPPGTKFEDLPYDWFCPWCKAIKDDFEEDF